MPLVLRVGFWIVASGAVVDVLSHASVVGGDGAALAGHLLSLLGMLVALAGVLMSAVRARARRLSDGVGHVPR
ncbi:MAG TPA: hypothetical protein VGX28_13725 [Frankiaceae bacterium]|jgi:hypothetical protein|nr:hypothetical protein [Frankiaceae bacterium]